jgi:hypothetical protein
VTSALGLIFYHLDSLMLLIPFSMPQMHWDPQIFMFSSFLVPVLKLRKLNIPEYKTGLSDFSSLAKFAYIFSLVASLPPLV